MAAVTLKDLMDPLTKIAVASEETNNNVKELLVEAISGRNTASKLEENLYKELKEQTSLLKTIAGNTQAVNAAGSDNSEDSSGIKEKLKRGAEFLQTIGVGAMSSAKAMLMWALVPKKVVTKFVNFVTNTFEALASQDTQAVEAGAEILRTLGESLFSFAKSLAKSLLLIIPGMIAIPFLVISIVTVGGAVALLGKFERPIKRGSSAIDDMGGSLIKFAIGLAGFALIGMLVLSNPVVLGAMASSLVIVGGAVAIIGLMSKLINRGSVALGFMGIALGIFSISYLVFAEATKDITFKDIGIQAAVLVGLGTVFGVAGAAFPFIALGAVAFGLVGIGLLLLTAGLAAFKKLEFGKKEAEDLAVTLAGVRLAFLGSDGDGGGIFKSVKNLFKGAIDGGTMIAAAAGFSAAGLSLIILSQGLKMYKKINWSLKDSEQMSLMLGSVTAAFAQAGGEPASPGGLFGKIFGNRFSPNAVERGINSVINAGRSLKGIAMGLTEFQKLIDSNVNFGTPDENGMYQKGSLGYAVTNTIGFVQSAFAAVAEQGNVSAGGFFNSLFNIKKNKVKEGIDSVKGAGEELINIVSGLQSFQTMVESNINWDTLANAIKKSITFVGEAFASIGSGKNEQEDGWFVFRWDENKVKKGIKAVRGAGEELSKIAQGLVTFQELKDPEAVAKGIESIFTSIGNTFTHYYEKDEFKNHLDHMKGFISELSMNAEEGYLEKAADGMQKIAEAVNSIEPNKAEAFADLFKGAGELQTNRTAYLQLADAIGQIKDLLGSAVTVNEGGETVSRLAPAQSDQSLNITLRNLNRTMGQVAGTLQQLPADIQSIKIVVPE